MQTIIQEQGMNVARIQATHCMGIPMQAYPVTLDRFKGLLTDQMEILKNLF